LRRSSALSFGPISLPTVALSRLELKLFELAMLADISTARKKRTIGPVARNKETRANSESGMHKARFAGRSFAAESDCTGTHVYTSRESSNYGTRRNTAGLIG